MDVMQKGWRAARSAVADVAPVARQCRRHSQHTRQQSLAQRWVRRDVDKGRPRCRAQTEEVADAAPVTRAGEDAAAFSLHNQTREQWTRFFAVLGVVSAVLVRLHGLSVTV